jgi:EmrB/QacA subfamily drug resistance transporter
MTRPPAGGQRNLSTHTGLAMVVVMTGVLITAVDTTIVVLALPEIERGLHVALSSVIWVVIGYLLVITLLATQVGRLGDMFGRVRMYEAGFLVFIIGSLLCALAWNETAIIGFRILQGIGGAFVTANSGAIIADLYPPERRGRAYGYNAVGWSLGAVLGIVMGGLIVTYVSWRWIFWINVPIGAGALLLATRVLHDRGARARRHLDLLGMVTLGLGLFGVLWAMTTLATSSFDASVAGYLVGGVVLICAFVLVELHQAEPMLDLSLFRIPTLAPSLFASLFQGLANFAVLFLVIMYLQGPRGLSPIHASLLLVPGYVVGSAVGPYAGRLADRLGPVLPATVGLGVQVVALFIYAHLSLQSGLWLVVVASVVNGVGASGFFPANSAAVMKASPPDVFGISSGMLRTFANIGMVFSFSVAILVASRSISKHLAFAIFVGTTTLHGRLAAAFTTGLHAAFYASMGFMALAAVLSATRARRARAAPHRGRAASGWRGLVAVRRTPRPDAPRPDDPARAAAQRLPGAAALLRSQGDREARAVARSPAPPVAAHDRSRSTAPSRRRSSWLAVERRFAGVAQLVLSSLTRDGRALTETTLWLWGLRLYGRRQLGTWWAQEQSRAHLHRLASVS